MYQPSISSLQDKSFAIKTFCLYAFIYEYLVTSNLNMKAQ